MFLRSENRSPTILITGGAGFIGVNLSAHLLATTDARVTVFDNLSHPGSEHNLAWLEAQAGKGRLNFVRGDIRSAARVIEETKKADEIYHLAARCEGGQESKTDFDVNVSGTLNVLEAARCSGRSPMVVYVSTSKVYGELRSLPLIRETNRYSPADPSFRGVSERMPVDFYSPFHCSKGAAERYVSDYGRFYNLPTVILRADTVVGPRQFADASHGWVAHCIYSTLAGRPFWIRESGLQVRDLLHVSDLVEAIMAARAYLGMTTGKVYNVGSGMAHSLSVFELMMLVEQVCHRKPKIQYEAAKPGDRLLYVGDPTAFFADTGWIARRPAEQAIRDISCFWHANQAHMAHPAERLALPARRWRHAA
jgi:CDP-paratose 2-epimerase